MCNSVDKKINLDKFSDECCYCFQTIKTSDIYICKCNLSLCIEHLPFHMDKFGCSFIYSVTHDETQGGVITNILDDSYIMSNVNLSDRIKSIIYAKELEAMICPHLTRQNFLIYHKEKCDRCAITTNLYNCLHCDFSGCGRVQYGSKGNGHSLEHFNANSDHFLFTKIINGEKAVYCYKCDSFIKNIPEINVIGENKGNDNEKILKTIGSAILTNRGIRDNSQYRGIVNPGNVCYIISTLELLSKIYRNKDLTVHYKECPLSPLECFACQFIKVIEGLNEKKDISANKIPPLVIDNLLEAVFSNFYFQRNEENDVMEFINVAFQYFESLNVKFLYKPLEFQIVDANNNQLEASTLLIVTHAKTISEAISNYIKDIGKESHLVLNDFLIVYVRRYSYDKNKGTAVKINDPIIADDIVNPSTGDLYSVDCLIKHEGLSITQGHYIFYSFDENVVVNNEHLCDGTYDDRVNGCLFLYKKTNK